MSFFNLGVNSSRFLYILSIFSYCWRSEIAVFSPTPASPGMLSEGSPFKARYSMYCDGLMPNLFLKNDSSTLSVSVIPLFCI